MKKSKLEKDIEYKSLQMGKTLAIIAEIKASFRFIQLGLTDLSNMKYIESNNHVILQLLSSGFERLIKSLLLLKEKYIYGSYPENYSGKKFFSQYKGGHGIDVMLDELLLYADGVSDMLSIKMVRDDIAYLKENNDFKRFINLLTEFSIFQRYFYIDTIVLDKYNEGANPFELFIDFIYRFLEGVDESSLTDEETDNLAIKRATICIEKGVRSISRFFTHGFGDLGRQYYADFSTFILLRDEHLGTSRYNKEILNPSDNYTPIKKTSLCYLKMILFCKTKKLRSSKFEGWPFSIVCIRIFNYKKKYYLVEIGNELFALTGTTSSHFEIPLYFKSKYLKPRCYATFLLEEAKKLDSNVKIQS